jgi:hypothetical protein
MIIDHPTLGYCTGFLTRVYLIGGEYPENTAKEIKFTDQLKSNFQVKYKPQPHFIAIQYSLTRGGQD